MTALFGGLTAVRPTRSSLFLIRAPVLGRMSLLGVGGGTYP